MKRRASLGPPTPTAGLRATRPPASACEFTCRPARSNPMGLVAVLGVLILIAYASYATLSDKTTTVVLMLVFVGYMASFLFPSHYRIDGEGIELTRIGVHQRFAWQHFRRYSLHRGGVFLARAVDGVRGVYLVMDKSQQALLLPYLDAHVARR